MIVYPREQFGEQALSLVQELAAVVRTLAKGTPQEDAAQELCVKAIRLETARINNAMLAEEQYRNWVERRFGKAFV